MDVTEKLPVHPGVVFPVNDNETSTADKETGPLQSEFYQVWFLIQHLSCDLKISC